MTKEGASKVNVNATLVNQPFSVVYDTGFNCIIKTLEPGMCYQAENISQKVLYQAPKKKSMQS